MQLQSSLPIRIITHNIRYAASPPSTGECPWSLRKHVVLAQLRYHSLYNAEAFICLQEALHPQLLDVLAGVGQSWTYIGVGRDDGKEGGEYSPILFSEDVWEVLKWRTVWLNEDGTPGKKGWDAGSVRIVTVGTFRHRVSGEVVGGLSTHLDNEGLVARRKSAKIILELVASLMTSGGQGKMPVFLAGDLNSTTTEEAYQILNSGTSRMRNASEMALWKYGEINTFTGFEDKEEDESVIDFVFLGPRRKNKWSVEGYSVLPNLFESKVFASDHRPVVVDAVLWA